MYYQSIAENEVKLVPRIPTTHSYHALIHSAIARVIGLTMIFAIAILTLPGVSRGQCPDNSWTGPEHWQVFIPGTGCLVTVYFCYKVDPDGTVEFTFEAVSEENTIPCSSLTTQQILSGAIAGFEAGPPALMLNITIPFCGQGTTTIMKYNTSQCWHLHDGEPVEYGDLCQACKWIVSCGDGACATECQYCQDPATHQIDEVSCSTWQVLAGNCQPPPPDWNDQYDVCYQAFPCQ